MNNQSPLKKILDHHQINADGFSESELIECLRKFVTGNSRKSQTLTVQAEQIYDAYPYKSGRGKAIQAIVKQLRSNKFEDLMEATKTFASMWQHGDKRYCPMPATWFNQERFRDGSDTWGPRDGGESLRDRIQSLVDMHPCNPESVNFHVYQGKPAPPKEKWDELDGLRERLKEMS